MSTKSTIVLLAVAAGVAALAAWTASSLAAPAQPQEVPDADWLAQAPPPGDRPDRPAPPGERFDRPGPRGDIEGPGSPGEGPWPQVRQRLEQLRRIQDQLRGLARESMPDQETLRRLARQLDQALAPLAEGPGPGLRPRWREFMERGSGPDERPMEQMRKEMRPLVEAGMHARAMKAQMEFLEQAQRLVSDRLQATIVAVRGIVDMSQDNPKQGIAALQPLLDQDLPLQVRTTVHMGLRDLYEKAGDRQAAIEQLVAVVKDNAHLGKEGERRNPPPPGPRQGPGERGPQPPPERRGPQPEMDSREYH